MSSADGDPGGQAVATEVVAGDEVATDELRERLLETLRSELGVAVVGSHIRPGDDLWVRVTADAWLAAGQAAKSSLGCTYFDFLSVIDWLPSPFGRDMDSQEDLVVSGAEPKPPAAMTTGYAGGDTRFQVFARVANIDEHFGITLKADVADEDPSIDSWVPLYAGANWHEREAWEMYGVDFVGHPHLVHIYLPGDFEGNPMRKDFPLLARRVKPWPGIVDVEPMPGSGDESDESDDGVEGGGDGG